MESQFAQFGPQTDQIDDLNCQAAELSISQPEQAARLFEQARALAQSGEFAHEPYRKGLAASLVGLAGLYAESTKPEVSARLCLEALALLDDRHPTPTTIDAQLKLGWLQLHIGNYSAAMDWAHKALQHSRALTLPVNEAKSLDLVASVQGLLTNFPQAVSAHETALQIARANQDKKAEISILNNMAMTLLDAGDCASALEKALQCLDLAHQHSLLIAEVNAHDTVGQILVAMGEFAQAEAHVQEALQTAPTLNSHLLQTYLLKNLGRVYLAQNDLSQAAAQIEQALAIALQVDLLGEQAECHQLLSIICELQADLAGALEHFKQFHTIKEKIAGEEAAKRLAILNVMHEVETAKRETEIHRLRNVELQSEIEERKLIQAALEKLAALDSLTGLYNRRHFLALAEKEFERVTRYRHPLAVVILDLDHFKQVNDTYGHAVGDQVLAIVAARLKSDLRDVDFAGRIGGEEFALVLPETTPAGARQVAERINHAISAKAMLTEAGPVVVTASAGVANLTPGVLPEIPSFFILLKHADQALYAAKRAGRNQVRTFEDASQT
jgi:diguanylate cyclase (GGDEF)-like protein